MENQASFGNRIRAVRSARDLSRETAAEEAGITPNYLGQIERGEKWPTFEVIVKLATALSVSPDTFFDFRGSDVSAEQVREEIAAVLAHKETSELLRALRVLKAMFIG